MMMGHPNVLSPLWRMVLVIALLLPAQITLQSATPTLAQTSVATPLFSHAHGLYNSSFQLTLSSPTSGAEIRYTTDFTTPTPTYGTLYTGPIQIANTTIVRAIAYTSSSNKSATVTQSYLFLAQVRNQARGNYNNDPSVANAVGPAWPREFFINDGFGPHPADYEMDPEIVDHPNYSNRVEGSLRSLPTLSLVTDAGHLWNPSSGIYANPMNKGAAWERPASVEWIDPSGATLGFTENAGIRMHGQSSREPRRTPKKNIRLYFKLNYGSPELEFKLFSSNTNDNDAVSKFDQLVLRNGGNRSWPYWDRVQREQTDYVNDEFVRNAWGEMGRLTSHGTYAHLYINGLYWGLYNLAERVDENHLANYLGTPDTDYDLIGNDEDLGDIPVAEIGDLNTYNQLLNLVKAKPVSNSTYAQVQQLLDVEDFADLFVLTHYVGKADWPTRNWYIYRKRSGPDQRFKMIPWDNDSSLNALSQNNTLVTSPQTPAYIFLQLVTNAEFKQLLADRLYKHLFNNGLLIPSRCVSRYSDLTAQIDQAVIAESARWGDFVRDVYAADPAKSLPAFLHSRDLDSATADPNNLVSDSVQRNWVQIRSEKLSNYCPNRGNVVIGQYKSNGWYLDTLKAPTFSQQGGAVSAGQNVTILNANGSTGEIYYTIDGSDPRQVGGAISSSARNGGDSVQVAINQVTWLKARIFNNGQWSVLYEQFFYPPQQTDNLVINEIHYHPPINGSTNPDEFEFIELVNKGATPLRLDNMKFTRGFAYQFPPNTQLAPGGYLALAKNFSQFQSRYGFAPTGQLRGNLSNGGEAIALNDALGNLVDFVDYRDLSPWPTEPDGNGPTLALCHPSLDNSQADSWRASQQNQGTPGQANGLNCGGTPINQPPFVAISTPANGATFSAGNTVTIQATANDLDGGVTLVQFYANGSLINGCTGNSQPYTCSFTPAAGAYALTAMATDNQNSSATSAVVNITVATVSNQPPTVSIVAPNHGSSHLINTPLTVKLAATDGDGTISHAAITINGNTLCEGANAQLECLWTPTALGSVTIGASATDNAGATTQASNITVNIVDTPPQGGFIEQNGEVTMEAENASNTVARGFHHWETQNPPVIAGAVGAVMVASPNQGTEIKKSITSTSPELQYLIQFTTPGKYYVWLRAAATSSKDNTVYLGLDGAKKTDFSISTGSSWKWIQKSLTIPSAGTHTLSLWMREDGFMVDRIYMTLSKSFKPSKVGPAESVRIMLEQQSPQMVEEGPEEGPVVEAPSTALTVTLALQNGPVAMLPAGTPLILLADANQVEGVETQVVFLVNGVEIADCDVSSAPYECLWTPPSEGTYTFSAVAYSDEATQASDPITVVVQGSQPEAPFTQQLYFPVIQVGQ